MSKPFFKLAPAAMVVLFLSIGIDSSQCKNLSLDKWTYIQVDDERTRYDGRTQGDGFWFGLGMGDATGDGNLDVVSGKWFYRNPGGNMEARWERSNFPDSIDALLILNVDGDAYGDVIGAKCNQQFWFEAKDEKGASWQARRIGTLPVCNHNTTTQGYNFAQIIPGGKPEILLHGKGIYCLQIPDKPDAGEWPSFTIIEEGGNGEWLSTGDMDKDGDLDVCAGLDPVDKESEANPVVWLENPGNGAGNWNKHEIGLTTSWADKIIPADYNADGFMDVVVTEERWPGVQPDANMFLFTDPGDAKKSNWDRKTIVTQYSMNNLDVADMDQDGDFDLITCEHKGPREKLQIWVNDGKGNFSEQIVDEGKESHLGARVADMDKDGDLDIVSIAWNDFQYVHLWRNDAILKGGMGRYKQPPLGLELKGDFKYRLPLVVGEDAYPRFDKPVELMMNFTEILKSLQVDKPFDFSSIRVVEVNEAGKTIDESVVFQFDKTENYDARTNAAGELVFIMAGNTPAKTKRHFHILFGEEGGYYVAPVFPKQVTFDDFIKHGGFSSFKIGSQGATYYYHKQGSGFTSMIDVENHDWISFQPGGGPKGEYRGIPNIAPANFHPGDGENNKVSRILSLGPIRVKILSETKDEKWGCTWSIYPNYATMTLFKKGDVPYWILYEGTPGGEFTPDDFGVNSKGEKFATDEHTIDRKWNGDLPAPEWVYFGDPNLNRVLYLAHHEYSDVIDEYWHFGAGGMTVFGFGRGPREEAWQRLTEVPTHLTIGFAESKDFKQVAQVINSAYQKIDFQVGKAQKIK